MVDDNKKVVFQKQDVISNRDRTLRDLLIETAKEKNNPSGYKTLMQRLQQTRIYGPKGEILNQSILDMTPNDLEGQSNLFNQIFWNEETSIIRKQGNSVVIDAIVKLNNLFKEKANMHTKDGYVSSLMKKNNPEYERLWDIRRSQKQIESAPLGIYKKISGVIANMTNSDIIEKIDKNILKKNTDIATEAKHLTSIMLLSGLRPADLENINIEQISSKGGVPGATLKGKRKNIILTEPVLDIIKELTEGRKSGPLFLDLKSAQNYANKVLKNAYPNGVEVFKPLTNKLVTENFTLYNLRNLNEGLLFSMDVPRLERDFLTGRAAQTAVADEYILNSEIRTKVQNLGMKALTRLSGYTGVNNLGQLLSDMGYEKIAQQNIKKVAGKAKPAYSQFVVTKETLNNANSDYIDVLDENFVNSLPDGPAGTISNQIITIDKDRIQLVKKFGNESLNYGILQVQEQSAKQERVTLKEQGKTEELKKKGQLYVPADFEETELSKKIDVDAAKKGIDRDTIDGQNKFLDDLLDEGGDDGKQFFSMDDLFNYKGPSGQGLSLKEQLDVIKDPNNIKKVLSGAFAIAGGIRSAAIKTGLRTGKFLIGDPIKNIADRPIDDPTGSFGQAIEQAKQLKMQQEMADIEGGMINVPEEDVVPETTEEKTQKQTDELGF